MPKSNRGGFGGRRSGTVTVIEEPVRRSSIRTAKIVFLHLWPVVGLLSATVLASKWHPILALLRGIGDRLGVACSSRPSCSSGPCCGSCGGGPPKSPWRSASVIGWVDLADHTTLPYRIGAVVLAVGVPAADPARTPLDHRGHLVPDHPAPHPGLLLRIHHHQPHRLPAAHLLGHPHPGRGTGLDLPAARPGPGRPAKPARPDRGGLLGRYRHRRIRLRVQLRAGAAGHQTPERLHRTGFHAAARTSSPPAPRPAITGTCRSPPHWTCPT